MALVWIFNLFKRYLTTALNSQIPNTTMAKTKELLKDTKNKIVNLHMTGKSGPTIGKQLVVNKSIMRAIIVKWKIYIIISFDWDWWAKFPELPGGELVIDLLRAETKATGGTISNTLRQQEIKSCSATIGPLLKTALV